MQKKSPKPDDVAVGQRVRLRRMMLGMSQEKLGEACGITFQQIQKYEKGTNRIGASRLIEIARALECTPADFLGDEFSGATPLSLGLSPVSLQLAQIVETLSPRARKLIRDQAVLLAELEGEPVEAGDPVDPSNDEDDIPVGFRPLPTSMSVRAAIRAAAE